MKRRVSLLIDREIWMRLPSRHFTICCIFVLAMTPLLYNLYFSLLQFELFQHVKGKTFAFILPVIGLFSSVNILTNVLERVSRYYVSLQKAKVSNALRTELFQSGLQHFHASEIPTSFGVSFKEFSKKLTDGVDILIRYFSRILSGVGGLLYTYFTLSSSIFLILLGVSIVLGGLSLLFRRSKRLAISYYAQFEETQNLLRNFVVEKDLIRSLNIERGVVKDLQTSQSKLVGVELKLSVYQLLREKYSKLCEPSVSLAVLVLTISLSKGTEDAHRLFSLIWLLNPIFSILPNITAYFEQKAVYDSVSKKLSELLSNLNNHCQSESRNSFRLDCISAKDLRISLNETECTMLDDFSLTQGQKLTVLGESGSGKSSFLRLLLAELRTYTGRLEVNAIDFRDTEPVDLLTEISYVDQDAVLIPGSICDNMYTPDCAEIRSLIDKVGLSHRFADIDLEQYEQWSNLLSGGERQRLAIARALSKPCRLLLLDEPYSALDSSNIEQMALLFDRGRSERMTVEVSHINIDHASDILLTAEKQTVSESG